MATQTVTEWDAQGKPVTPSPSAGVNEWDAQGNPVKSAGMPSPAAAPAQAPQPSKLQRAGQLAGTGLASMGREEASTLSGGALGTDFGSDPAKYLQSQVDQIKPPSAWQSIKTADPTGLLAAGEGAYDMAVGAANTVKNIAAGLYHHNWDNVAAEAGKAIGDIAIGQAMMHGDPELSKQARSAQQLLEQNLSANKAQVGIMNGMVRAPLTQLDKSIGDEVTRHVEPVLRTDEIDMKLKGNPVGNVNTAKAASAMEQKSLETMKGVSNSAYQLVTRGMEGPMSMRMAKSLTTDVGRMASSLSRQGATREAAAMWTYYDALHDATAARAKDLGASKSWQHYIDESSAWHKMQDGLAGDLMSDPSHASALSKLLDPKNAKELSELKDKMTQYGIDPAPLDEAARTGTTLQQLQTKIGSAFAGKIKAMKDHPLMVGAPTVAGAVAGHAVGGWYGGTVMPLIIAGKISGMLDRRAIASLLKDVESKVPPESFQVRPPGEGPQPVDAARPTSPIMPKQKMLPPAGSIQVGPASKGELPEYDPRTDVGKDPLAPMLDPLQPQTKAQQVKQVQIAKGSPNNPKGLSPDEIKQADFKAKVSKARAMRAHAKKAKSSGGSRPTRSIGAASSEEMTARERFERVKAARINAEGKGYHEQRFPKSYRVEVNWPDGDRIEDEVKGLNEGHALSRAKGNWLDADYIRILGESEKK